MTTDNVATAAEAGHGLLGLRERVSVYGGSMVARPRSEGGFELIATLHAELGPRRSELLAGWGRAVHAAKAWAEHSA